MKIAPGRSLQANVRVAVLVLSAIGFLAVVAGIEVFSITDKTLDYQATLEQTSMERAQIRRVMSMLHEAETSQRGFLLTQRDDYLNRFNEISRELSRSLDELALGLNRDREQASRARRLKGLSLALLKPLSRRLSADGRAEEGAFTQPETVISRSEIDAALKTKVRIDELLGEMIALEDQKIRIASIGLSEQIRFSGTVMIALLVSIVLLATFAVGLGLAYLAHRGRVESELLEATQLAREASEAKTQFLAAMSHEIRTPLTGILGYAELLGEEPLASHQRDYVARLEVAAVGLSALVDDILDFSRVEAGEIEVIDAPFCLGTLIADCLSITSVTAQKKAIALGSDLDPSLPRTVVGDELRLRQVLLNLLNNAVKFTRLGSVTLRVSAIGQSGEQRHIRFEVVDTGIGIAPEMQGLLFQRFSQIDSSAQREYGGTGLGLAICKGLVELMRGEIGVESRPGRGSTFWFSLPFLVAGAPAPEGHSEEGEPLVAAGGRVLLAEDARQNQDLVRTILAAEGYAVDIADDGAAAVAAARSARYDLILMDIQMPRMDGATAARKIRALGGAAGRVPIIAMTANVLPEQLDAFRKAGMDDHIGKPFRKRRLVAKVREWLPAQPHPEAVPHPRKDRTERHDRAAFGEIRELMGEEWTRTSLRRLKRRIDETLEVLANDKTNRETIKRHAHGLVADAGQLGFAELAGACISLEEACGGDVDLRQHEERLRQAAAGARSALARLLGECSAAAQVR